MIFKELLFTCAFFRGDELQHAQDRWQQYHEDVRALGARIQEMQTSVMGPPITATTSLDSLVTSINVSFNFIENKTSLWDGRGRGVVSFWETC